VQALRAIDGWPAPNAAAAVVSPRGTFTRGDAARDFAWASVTKLVTALATLVAVEEGIVDLEEPAGPEGSTVRHLLAHASGLPPEEGGSLSRVAARRIYSNWGFDLLGALVAERAEMPFAQYVDALGLGVELRGRPAAGAHGSLETLVALARELSAPTLVAPETLAEATTVAFPGLDGVLPGFGRQEPNDWGLGFELRDGKAPHWTGSANSTRTFGHFGRSGTFLWVDPDAGAALAVLTDLEFGPWAAEAWPALSDAVLAELRQEPASSS
jgi:CubicO group peptidase (beta-lactamase class C family)